MATPWAFLAPWWRVLQAHELLVASRHRGFREELFGLSVSICPRRRSSEGDVLRTPVEEMSTQIPQLRDAVELAFLLAVVDRPVFEQAMSGHVREHARAEATTVFETHPNDSLTHVELKFDVVKPSQAILREAIAALATFVTPQPLEDRDPAFQEARLQLLAQILPSETVKREKCESLQISVGLSRSFLEPPSELMRVLDRATTTSVALEWPAYPFVPARYSVYIQETTFTPETTTKIDSWPTSELPFDRVSITSEDWHSLLHFGRALSSVFLSEGSAGRADAEKTFVEAAVHEFANPDRFAQVCSAIMHTQRVKSLEIPMNMRDQQSPLARRQRMRWIFFALFSRWATHSIEEVSLNRLDFSEAEFEDLEQLLLCENPLPLLYEVDDANGSARQVLASKDATLSLDLSPERQNAGERQSIKITEETWFDVIGEEEDELLVLVPAYGKCRLRRGDTSQVRDSVPPHDHTERLIGCRGIKSLGFEPKFDHGEGRGIFPFLRRVGPQLEALSCLGFSTSQPGTLVPMLTSCPSLKRLHLQSALPEMLPQLMEAYATGACKAESLDLRYLMDQRESRHVTRLYETLADPTQPLAQILREFLFCNRAVHWPMPDAEIAMMRTMLERNTVLEYFERTCRPAHNEAFTALCRELNNATIAIIPVPPRSKIAFLSVVSSDALSLVPPSVQLDSVMISRIFDMAARRVQRQVHVGSYISMYFH